jgi:hypothetical protein
MISPARMFRIENTKIGILACVVLLAAGCQRPVAPEDGQTAPPDELAPIVINQDAVRYELDTDSSWTKILVYRGGRLAQLGHNHVISSDDLRGELYLGKQLVDSAFEIRMPVATLAVDRPELRALAGDDFPGELDQSAIDGTRANMLGALQLDAVVWPEVVLRSRSVRGEPDDLHAQVAIMVKGQIYNTDIPMRVSVENETVLVTGRFNLLQTDIGIEPFSVMMGALKVRDELEIEFRIVARRLGPPESAG